MNMEEEGNAYTCLGTHPQEFTRKRTHKGTRGSNKRARGCIEICMYIWMQAYVYVRWEGGEK